MTGEVATCERLGSREFKKRMGRYLSEVRKGLITDRGQPVAKVSPPELEESATTPWTKD